MSVMIRCNFCGKLMPYYDNEFYKIKMTGEKYNRYCSEWCAEQRIKNENTKSI